VNAQQSITKVAICEWKNPNNCVDTYAGMLWVKAD